MTVVNVEMPAAITHTEAREQYGLLRRARAALVTKIGAVTGFVLGGGQGMGEFVAKVQGAEGDRFRTTRKIAAHALALAAVTMRSGQLTRMAEIGMEIMPDFENSADVTPPSHSLEAQVAAAPQEATPAEVASPAASVRIESGDGLYRLTENMAEAYDLSSEKVEEVIEDVLKAKSQNAQHLQDTLLADGPGHENYQTSDGNIALGYTGALNAQDRAGFETYFSAVTVPTFPESQITADVFENLLERQDPDLRSVVDVVSYNSETDRMEVVYDDSPLRIELPDDVLSDDTASLRPQTLEAMKDAFVENDVANLEYPTLPAERVDTTLIAIEQMWRDAPTSKYAIPFVLPAFAGVLLSRDKIFGVDAFVSNHPRHAKLRQKVESYNNALAEKVDALHDIRYKLEQHRKTLKTPNERADLDAKIRTIDDAMSELYARQVRFFAKLEVTS